MDVIQSSDNSKVKRVVKLADKKYRDIEGCYVAEGKRWIFDAVQKGADVEFIGVAQSHFNEFEKALSGINCPVFIFSDPVFNKMSQVENSQGILAVVKIKKSELTFQSQHCLFLDRIRDPGNLGTIIRTACAAGFTDIILNNCVDAYSPKVIRTSMSAILDVRLFDGGIELIDKAVESGYAVVGAVIDGADVFESKLKLEKILLIIGSEADGISDDILKKCTYKVKIPMHNNMESLNAAVSAGILMYVLKYPLI